MEIQKTRKKVILTGGTGTIGRAIIEECTLRKWEVCVIVNPASKRKESIPKNEFVSIVECDLKNIQDLCILPQCQGAEHFLHLGWEGTFGIERQNEERQQKNIVYALEACKTAQKIGCKTFLYAGSQAEFGRVEGRLNGNVSTHPENAYGKAKLSAGLKTRELCKKLGIKHIYFRILSIYGPGDGENTMISSTIRKLQAGISPEFTPAEQMWDYLYSQDAAVAMLDACERGKTDRIYCLGSGVARPLREYIEIMGEIVNPKISLGIGALPYGEKQVMHLQADISDLTEDFGFEPKVSFEEGIRKLRMER